MSNERLGPIFYFVKLLPKILGDVFDLVSVSYTHLTLPTNREV